MEQISAPPIDYGLLLALAAPALGAMLLVVLGATGRLSSRAAAGLTVATCVVAVVLLALLWREPRSAFSGMVVGDDLLVFTGGLLLAATAVSALLSASYLEHYRLDPAEYYALMLFVTSGGLMLLAASNLLMLIIGLEVLSLGMYLLTGYARGRHFSDEAAMKYFLLGAFSVGFMIYGTALVYGAAGSLSYSDMAGGLDAGNGLASLGVGLLFVGFAFKLALVPFHMWTPDAYVGAPTSVTAFMSVATKVATFGALLRFLFMAVPNLGALTSTLLVVLATATMVWGNLAAVIQTDIKRMLAYSSIGQAGYIVVALVAGDDGRIAMGFYLLAYAVTNLGAFAAVLAAGGGTDERLSLRSYEGLGRQRPFAAAMLTVFLLSLAGIPPTAGFWAKLFAFRAAVSSGYTALAFVGILTSAVAAYYYIRVIALMYMGTATVEAPGESAAGARARIPGSLLAVLAIALVLTVLLGILPDLPSELTRAGLFQLTPTAQLR
ncbi:MAG: NADH-quinone oxidoreductase subunit N [Chloroflexota bacterium]|nr:NADH-quinone oxidoreductase subunit N [Chloroflexota bacterium]